MAVLNEHNLRAATFNSHVRELTQRTADLSESRKANTALQQQLGQAQTALRSKEAECNTVAQERYRLAKQLADQEKRHQAALHAVKDSETALQGEYKTQAANWVESERALSDGYGQVEDMVDEYFPGYSVAASQAIEAHHQARRHAGCPIHPPLPSRSPPLSSLGSLPIQKSTGPTTSSPRSSQIHLFNQPPTTSLDFHAAQIAAANHHPRPDPGGDELLPCAPPLDPVALCLRPALPPVAVPRSPGHLDATRNQRPAVGSIKSSTRSTSKVPWTTTPPLCRASSRDQATHPRRHLDRPSRPRAPHQCPSPETRASSRTPQAAPSGDPAAGDHDQDRPCPAPLLPCLFLPPRASLSHLSHTGNHHSRRPFVTPRRIRDTYLDLLPSRPDPPPTRIASRRPCRQVDAVASASSTSSRCSPACPARVSLLVDHTLVQRLAWNTLRGPAAPPAGHTSPPTRARPTGFRFIPEL
ncbi:proline-rich protein 36-like [Triticum aestivum]|uniref:proline-rich protein 36-like n=1 Tax=Triticum aestivum TaxID=4565 RepID=UPI001D025841|nr:proline-rich protein 36-like [Triticum aestivum]